MFEILFDWIRDGRRIYVLGRGDNRYQLLAVEDLVDAIVRASTADVAGEVFNVGATEFGTVRSDLEALIAHAGTSSRLRPVPARPAELALRALELAQLSPLGEWHYKTASRDSFVDVSKAERLLGWRATKSNVETLVENYDWYVANRARMQAAGVTHRVPVEPAGALLAEEGLVTCWCCRATTSRRCSISTRSSTRSPTRSSTSAPGARRCRSALPRSRGTACSA